MRTVLIAAVVVLGAGIATAVIVGALDRPDQEAPLVSAPDPTPPPESPQAPAPPPGPDRPAKAPMTLRDPDLIVIPQDESKREERNQGMIAWTRRTLADPYDRVGSRDPRWDDQVHSLMELAANRFSGQAADGVSFAEVFEAARAALDAGCDDPMVRYLYARTSIAENDPGPVEYRRRMDDAADALEASAYPPIRRASALIYAAIENARVQDDPEAAAEASRQVDAALALLGESVEQDGFGPEAATTWFSIVSQAIALRQAMLGDSAQGYQTVADAIADVPGVDSLRQKARGSFLIDHAWEARGNDFAPMVSEEAFRVFHERLQQARTALEASWEASPGDSVTAQKMLSVELGLGEGDRERVTLWFRRAMEADPDNYDACIGLLTWLEPKWYGSAEEMMTFARACRATDNWEGRLPLVLAEAHLRLMCYLDSFNQSLYLQKPEVQQDLGEIYSEYLERQPDDVVARTNAAMTAVMCGQFVAAAEHFDRLGPNLVATPYFTIDSVLEAREKVRAHLALFESLEDEPAPE
ncbi:DUF4034 domain-containing protein [Tautonia sociabilis]|uniref:DUF4034 domain-containing protein n=1 Tax=Tautonia sociabilis TaxID=2080755 RepID=A0A432MRY8_9BACT|nr:DUF4034 domain-containing protein [Tautonia sociabilis]RUL89705.1 DUF4034 domain-containing protein [Tautonia sociabilis]